MSQHNHLIPLNQHLRNLYKEALLATNAAAIFFSSFETTEHVLKTMAASGIRFKVLLGKYDNQFETAYTTAADNLEWLIASGLVDGQESLMFVSNDGIGFLMYNKFDENGELKIEPLGEVLNISKEEAEQRTAFTFDPEDGLYYGTTVAKAS